jgi:hypothetical protein
MDTIPGWRTDQVEVVRSPSGTIALVDYRDNFRVGHLEPWPPPEIAQKLFQSQKMDFFPPEGHAALQGCLGHYCDLQSINSEDALTWNVFGHAAHADPDRKALFARSVLAQLGLEERGRTAQIWVWRRLPHPETLGGNGPELDFGISYGSTLVLGENKWHGSVSQGQGLLKDQDQIQIRMAFLKRAGRFLFPSVERFIVLGVSIAGDLLEAGTTQLDGLEVRSANLTWDSLVGGLDDQGHGDLQDYLSWKKTYGRAHRSESDLLPKLELRVPSRVTLVNPPDGFAALLGELPTGLELNGDGLGEVDTVMVFARTASQLEQTLSSSVDLVRQGGKIWVCWPIRTSELRGDLGKDKVIAEGDRLGLVRVKAARIDRTWTSFKFYRRAGTGSRC